MSTFSKLTKVNESFTVYRYNNGYMIEVSGRDHNEEWKTIKTICQSETELLSLIQEVNLIELDS